MDKKRKMEIKHPQLRKIRDALRKAIVDATYDRLSEIMDEQGKYPVEEKEKLIPLVRKEQALRRALKASICICPICNSQTSDMIHNPHNKSWYCLDCYQELHEWYKHSPNSTESRHAPNPFP